MSITSWLRKRVSNSSSRGTGQRRPCFRPQLEALNDRLVPSMLTVTNNLDTGVAGDGSLRGEIAAAEAATPSFSTRASADRQSISSTPAFPPSTARWSSART